MIFYYCLWCHAIEHVSKYCEIMQHRHDNGITFLKKFTTKRDLNMFRKELKKCQARKAGSALPEH